MDTLEKLRKRINKELTEEKDLTSNIISVILFGSMIRGDFIDGVSDLDYFVVFKAQPDETTRLYETLVEASKGIPFRVIDFAWTIEENLTDPTHKGFPFKFLTIYQRDFKANHHVLYGKDIVDILPRYDEAELIEWRLNRIIENIENFRERPDLLRITAGETCRLAALMNGAKDISKQKIRKKLEETGDSEALYIFDAYLSGVELEKPISYWEEFIKTRIEALKGKQIKKKHQ